MRRREEDFKRFAEKNIACTAGLTWHVTDELSLAILPEYIDEEYVLHGYPIKSFFDAGVKVSSHTDYPANGTCPQDPFGIMEVAVTGQIKMQKDRRFSPLSPEEYMSSEDIQAMLKAFNLTRMYNSNLDATTFLNQIALGTGAGLRLDYESIVVRLDLGVAVHAPFDTGRAGYYNIPNLWKDGLRLNFGIGYPF